MWTRKLWVLCGVVRRAVSQEGRRSGYNLDLLYFISTIWRISLSCLPQFFCICKMSELNTLVLFRLYFQNSGTEDEAPQNEEGFGGKLRCPLPISQQFALICFKYWFPFKMSFDWGHLVKRCEFWGTRFSPGFFWALRASDSGKDSHARKETHWILMSNLSFFSYSFLKTNSSNKR